MKRDDQQFEEYLREFTPRGPAALRLPTVAEQWRRFAAAAAIVIITGGFAWLGQETRLGSRLEQQAKQNFRDEKPGGTQVTLGRLRTLVNDPVQMDAALTHASRQELPDFRDSSSALRVLAKE